MHRELGIAHTAEMIDQKLDDRRHSLDKKDAAATEGDDVGGARLFCTRSPGKLSG